MQEDAHFTVCILLVAESILNFGLASICSAGEEVGAHSNGNLSTDINLVVLEDHVRPSLAAVDGKASILSIALLDSFVPNKVGHGICASWSKRRFGCLGWFEEHVRVSIAIKLTGWFASGCYVVSSIQVGLGDTLDGTGPRCLCSLHFFFGNLCSWRSKGH